MSRSIRSYRTDSRSQVQIDVGFHFAYRGLSAMEQRKLGKRPADLMVGAVQPNLRAVEKSGRGDRALIGDARNGRSVDYRDLEIAPTRAVR